MYSEKVMDHFEHPRNVGEIEGASGVVLSETPSAEISCAFILISTITRLFRM